jgi:hypothetical protein
MHAVVQGLSSGALATVPMTLAMAAYRAADADRRGRPLPPTAVACGVARRTGVRPDPGSAAFRAFTTVSHVGYGAAMGAVFAGIRAAAPGIGRRASSSVAAGVAFGLGVWAGSYAGWLPALGIVPPPRRQPEGFNRQLVVSHVCFGGALGLLAHGFEKLARSPRVRPCGAGGGGATGRLNLPGPAANTLGNA